MKKEIKVTVREFCLINGELYVELEVFTEGFKKRVKVINYSKAVSETKRFGEIKK